MSDDAESSISSAAGRVETIIDAAESAAAGIREQARAEADGYAERAGREVDRVTFKRIAAMSEMTERLIEHVDQLQAQAEEVIRALQDTMRALAAMAREPYAGGPPSDTVWPADADRESPEPPRSPD